ncbi:MAG: sigma 54-interacting transcriptional regulator [Candidatus Eisenbacteria bacterium]
MAGNWQEIERLSAFVASVGEGGDLAQEERVKALARLVLSKATTAGHGSSPDTSILMGWCYAALGNYEAALREARGVDLSSPELSDRQFFACVSLCTRSLQLLGRYEEATDFDNAIKERCADSLPRVSLDSLLHIGACFLRLSAYDTAERCFQGVAALAHLFDDAERQAWAMLNLSLILKNTGRLARAEECVRDAIVLASSSQTDRIGSFYLAAGQLSFWSGDFGGSAIRFLEGLKGARRHCRRRTVLRAHLSLGRTYLALEDFAKARRHLEKGLEMALQLKFPREEALACEFLGDLERAEGRSENAGDLYRKGLEIGLRIAPRGDVVCEVGRRLADWHTERGEHNEARRELGRALEIAEATGDRREEGILHRVRARLIVASGGRYQSAEASLKKSVEILADVGARYELTLSLAARARLRAEAPRRTREERRRGLDDFQSAAVVLGEIGLPRKQGLLLLEAARSLSGALSPYEGLSLLREAEEVLRAHRSNEILAEITSLRSAFEEETARIAIEKEGPFLLGEGEERSFEPAVRLLARRLGAKRAFLHLPSAPEGARVVGCEPLEACEILSRLRFPSDRNLIVSAGVVSKEESTSYGPFLAFRTADGEPSVVYLERRIGGEPFNEKQAGEFAACAERLFRKIPCVRSAPERGPYPKIIAGSRAMQDVVDRIVSVRNSSATVLIEGETGTGKGLLARLLHELRDRSRTGRFVHLHCAELH